MDNVEFIKKDEQVYAIFLPKEYCTPGPNFFTPKEFSQQLGMLLHKKGKIVKRHRHKLVKREIFQTQEVLVLLDGKVKVEIFDDNGNSLSIIIMKPGDSILLAQGGHMVEVLEDAKLIEVKQGPYAGFEDKEFF